MAKSAFKKISVNIPADLYEKIAAAQKACGAPNRSIVIIEALYSGLQPRQHGIAEVTARLGTAAGNLERLAETGKVRISHSQARQLAREASSVMLDIQMTSRKFSLCAPI